MNPPTVGMRFFRRPGLSVTFLIGAVLGAAACGGSDSSEEASNTPSEGGGAVATAETGSTAPMGTGFIMMSAMSQLQLTEGTFLEESDCAARVSTLGDAAEYERCLAVPAAAICLRISEGQRASDSWWECFVEETVCEEAIAGHEVVREVGGYVREIVLGCTETELASVFASM